MEIRRMNRSPKVDMNSALCGQKWPIAAPKSMPAKTCTDMSL